MVWLEWDKKMSDRIDPITGAKIGEYADEVAPRE
ncbi:MAG: hypothetical protein CM15mP6_0300 [Methanobacteriota archaeon]|nr:MAG: hypothetical protein CM15mP6_0300 [Euryarchaeota archaeon]